MGIETRKRIAELYRAGKWRQDDAVAKAFADELAPVEIEEVKDNSKRKRGA